MFATTAQTTILRAVRTRSRTRSRANLSIDRSVDPFIVDPSQPIRPMMMIDACVRTTDPGNGSIEPNLGCRLSSFHETVVR